MFPRAVAEVNSVKRKKQKRPSERWAVGVRVHAFFVSDYEEVGHLKEALSVWPKAPGHNEEDPNSLLLKRTEGLQEFLQVYPVPSSQAGTQNTKSMGPPNPCVPETGDDLREAHLRVEI